MQPGRAYSSSRLQPALVFPWVLLEGKLVLSTVEHHGGVGVQVLLVLKSGQENRPSCIKSGAP